MIENYLKPYSFSEVNDIINDVDQTFNPYEMDYPTLYGAIDINSEPEVWSALNLVDLGPEHYIGESPCVEGYFLIAIAYRGVIFVYGNHAGANNWYCCIALVGDDIFLLQLTGVSPQHIYRWTADTFFEELSSKTE